MLKGYPYSKLKLANQQYFACRKSLTPLSGSKMPSPTLPAGNGCWIARRSKRPLTYDIHVQGIWESTSYLKRPRRSLTGRIIKSPETNFMLHDRRRTTRNPKWIKLCFHLHHHLKYTRLILLVT